ncbi:MAG: hypothetical protein GF405_07460 [Candidatus Eisenbacteria bacterium]|nr:hypothetical protein [Candidatus Eisenbacteria bacterium]
MSTRGGRRPGGPKRRPPRRGGVMGRRPTQKERTRRTFIRLVILVAVALMLWFNAERIHVAYLSALVLAESGTPLESGPAEVRLPDPVVADVRYEGAGRTIDATLYLPSEGEPPYPGLVVNHGVAAGGRDDARLTNFADAMARAGFAVLAPDFVNLRGFQVRLSDVDELVASFEYLASREDVDERRVGMFGLSYAGGLALLAAADERINKDVAFLFLLGAYYDLRHIVTYMTTGYHREDGEWVYLEPRNAGRWGFLLNSVGLVETESDREPLRRIAERRYEAPDADVSDLVPKLSEEGRLIVDLMTNDDPERALELTGRLNPRIRRYLDMLSPAGTLDRVRARLIIGHGYDDDMMPYTESVLIAENAPPQAEVHLELLESFQHVDLTIGGGKGLLGFFRSLPELWRLFSITYDLLETGLLPNACVTA